MQKHHVLERRRVLQRTLWLFFCAGIALILMQSTAWAQTAVLDLKLPLGDSVGGVNPEDVSVEVTVRTTGMQVVVAAGGASRLVGDIPASAKKQDYKKLSEVLQQVKKSFPDKRDIVLLSTPNVDYQTLVAVMDTSRTFETVVAASVVDAVLFPEVSLGDATLPEQAAVEGAL